MSRALQQKVEATLNLNPNENQKPDLVATIQGTNNRNLRSKISNWIQTLLVQYNVNEGAKITIDIKPAEPDQFARPEPE